MDPAALDGVLVADFSRVLAGPYATMLLADLGGKRDRLLAGMRVVRRGRSTTKRT